jgi:outer membrane protein assembly factor BamB
MRDQFRLPKFRAWRNSCRALIAGVLFVGCLVVSSRPVGAQAPRLVAGVDEDAPQGQHPFLLPAQPTEIGEAIEDFRRFAGRKQWEKAFKHLQKVFDATSTGLVLTDSGIMLPSRLIAREALLELPPAGQDAYRLFFDAEAKKLLEQAQGPGELTKLTQIFTRYLVTSIGDEAANRLGDLHFEAGNFAQAVHCWRAILEERPDSRLSRARLRVKVAVGMARLERWGEFRQLLRVIEDQHSQEKMRIGGKEVGAADYLRPFLERSRTTGSQAASSRQTLPPDIPLSGDPAPLWQFRFFPHHDPLKENQPPGLRMQQNWGWGGGGGNVSDAVPPIAVDEARVYANFVGYALGIDQQNGKLLWRSGRFLDAPQKAQQGQLQSIEQFGIAVGGERTWSVTTDPTPNNNNQPRGRFPGDGNAGGFGIWARETVTGKEILASKNIAELKEWSFRGNPLLAGERIFVCASKPNQRGELHVLALHPKDARLLWSTLVGTYVGEQQYYYYQMERGTQPSLLIDGDRLYVDTHAGSLAQIDAVSGQVDWGLNYASDPQQNQGMWWGGYRMQVDRLSASAPQMVNGVLYVKGMRSRRLYAVDPQRPKVLWSRPVPKSAILIGVDEQRFYLGGDEISAYDANTRKILWSVNVTPGTSWNRPLLTQGRIYSFSPRGIYEIDKAAGKVVHLLRGADGYSLGGELIVAPHCLLAVSNLAITAYPLGAPPAAANLLGRQTFADALAPEFRTTGNKESLR